MYDLPAARLLDGVNNGIEIVDVDSDASAPGLTARFDHPNIILAIQVSLWELFGQFFNCIIYIFHCIIRVYFVRIVVLNVLQPLLLKQLLCLLDDFLLRHL